MAVATADGAVVRVEGAVAALGLIAEANHGGRVGARHSLRAVDPEPGVVGDQQLRVNVGVAEFPPTQLRGAPHRFDRRPTGVDAVGDGAIELSVRGCEEPRHRSGVAVALRVESRHGDRSGTALRRPDDGVPGRGEALVCGEPVRQLGGKEGLPLLAAVPFPVGVHGVGAAGRGGNRESGAGECVHRVARGYPVADCGSGVESVQQNHRARSAALERHRDVAPHGRGRNHQVLDSGRAGRGRGRTPDADGQQGGEQRPESFHQTAHTRLTACLNKSLSAVVNHTHEPGVSGLASSAGRQLASTGSGAAAGGGGDGCGVAPSTR